MGFYLLAAAVAMAIFPARIPNILIAAGALAGAAAMFVFHPENPFSMAINVFVGLSLVAAAAVAWVALMRGGLPAGAGAPPERRRPRAGPKAPRRMAGLPGHPRGDHDLRALGLRLLGPAQGQAGHHAGSCLRDREPRGPP